MKTEIDINLGKEEQKKEIEIENEEFGDFEIVEDVREYPKRKFTNRLPMKVLEDLGIPLSDLRGITELRTTKDLKIARALIAGLLIDGPPIADDVDIFEILHYMPVLHRFLANSRAKSAIEKLRSKRSSMR